jgi:hypothetical protein
VIDDEEDESCERSIINVMTKVGEDILEWVLHLLPSEEDSSQTTFPFHYITY